MSYESPFSRPIPNRTHESVQARETYERCKPTNANFSFEINYAGKNLAVDILDSVEIDAELEDLVNHPTELEQLRIAWPQNPMDDTKTRLRTQKKLQ